MKPKKSFGKQVEQVLEGRGFYIVMALCAAIIGVSIWSLLKTPAEMAPDEAEFDEVLSEVQPAEYDPADLAWQDTEEKADESEEKPEAEEPEVQETAADAAPVWPVDGEIQREYSIDALQYDPTMTDWRIHDGLDIEAEIGTKVRAVRSGKVLNVFADDLYGTTVEIDHGNGLVIRYANLEQIPTVYAGDSVSAGDVIGSVGESAKCESAQSGHLHLTAAMSGNSVSPMDYLPKKS